MISKRTAAGTFTPYTAVREARAVMTEAARRISTARFFWVFLVRCAVGGRAVHDEADFATSRHPVDGSVAQELIYRSQFAEPWRPVRLGQPSERGFLAKNAD